MQNSPNNDSLPNSNSGTWSPSLPLSLLATLSGGIIGLLVVQSIDPFFKFADLPELGIAPRPELVVKHRDATTAFWTNNFALNFGIIGLCIGSAVGFLSGKTRRIAAAFSGGVGGAVGGAVSSYLIGMLVAKAIILSSDQSLVQSTLFHFAVWASILTLAIVPIGIIRDGVRFAPKFALAGLGLGLVVAVVYNLASSIFFSHANLLMLLPTTTVERFVWISVCAIASGVGLHLGLRPRQLPVNQKPVTDSPTA